LARRIRADASATGKRKHDRHSNKNEYDLWATSEWTLRE
jgi:hypothetical protein